MTSGLTGPCAKAGLIPYSGAKLNTKGNKWGLIYLLKREGESQRTHITLKNDKNKHAMSPSYPGTSQILLSSLYKAPHHHHTAELYIFFWYLQIKTEHHMQSFSQPGLNSPF